MARSIDAKKMVKYLRNSDRGSVERFVSECQTQMRILGIDPKKDKTKPHTRRIPQGSDAVNQASILAWIKSVTKEEGLKTLLMLHATGKARL